MDYVLGIDLGTSYFKLGLFNKAGDLCGLGRVAVEKDVDDGSLCELSIERFWEFLKEALADACREANALREDIKAVAYSSQANSFVLLDEKNRPLTPLVLWVDTRAEDIYPEVKQLWQREDFLQRTGLGIGYSNQFCVNKLLWFQKNRSELWNNVNRIMTISDYLTFSVTGQTLGDMGTASLLGLLDSQKTRWWGEALDIIGVRSSQLSEPLLVGTVAGKVSAEGAEYLGLQKGIPFALGSLDHHMAAIGAGVGEIAEAGESTGTVLACLNLNEQYQPRQGRCVGPSLGGENYYQLAFNGNGAGVLQWYQKKYAPDLSIEQLVKMAQEITPGCDGLVALAEANQYENLLGFKNRTDKHSHGHFIRAIMESTAGSLAELVEQLCGEGKPNRIVATGGGAKSNLWLQIKADMLGTEFVTINCIEPACKGAAMLGARAAGWFKSVQACAKQWTTVKTHIRPEK